VKLFGRDTVPPGVVTTILPVPALPAAVVAVICPALLTVKLDAGEPAIKTDEAFERFAPRITTEVPPVVGPAPGELEVSVGGLT